MVSTNKQKRLLRHMKLPVPEDFEAAKRLIDYVLKGNGSRGGDSKERRQIVRDYWERWVGQGVQIVGHNHQFRQNTGIVIFLWARTEEEVNNIKADDRTRSPLPFVAIVRLDCGSRKNVLAEVRLNDLKHVSMRQQALFV